MPTTTRWPKPKASSADAAAVPAAAVYDHFVGRLVEKGPTSLVIEAGGVGYRLDVPLSTYERVKAKGPDDIVRVLAFLHVREDDLKLYGFATAAERRLFSHLITIKGVGPGIALQVLSRHSVVDVCRAIRDEDTRFLDKIPRVGTKTAERIVLELRGKEDILEIEAAALEDARAESGAAGPSAGAAAGGRPGAARGAGVEDDASRALVSLGYTPAVARRAVEAAVQALGRQGEGVPAVERLVKEALRQVVAV